MPSWNEICKSLDGGGESKSRGRDDDKDLSRTMSNFDLRDAVQREADERRHMCKAVTSAGFLQMRKTRNRFLEKYIFIDVAGSRSPKDPRLGATTIEASRVATRKIILTSRPGRARSSRVIMTWTRKAHQRRAMRRRPRTGENQQTPFLGEVGHDM